MASHIESLPITAGTKLKFRVGLALFCAIALVQLGSSFGNFCHDGAGFVAFVLWLFLGFQLNAVAEVYLSKRIAAPDRSDELVRVVSTWWRGGTPFMWILAYACAVALLVDLNGRYVISPVTGTAGPAAQVERTDRWSSKTQSYPAAFCATHNVVNDLKEKFLHNKFVIMIEERLSKNAIRQPP